MKIPSDTPPPGAGPSTVPPRVPRPQDRRLTASQPVDAAEAVARCEAPAGEPFAAVPADGGALVGDRIATPSTTEHYIDAATDEGVRVTRVTETHVHVKIASGGASSRRVRHIPHAHFAERLSEIPRDCHVHRCSLARPHLKRMPLGAT